MKVKVPPRTALHRSFLPMLTGLIVLRVIRVMIVSRRRGLFDVVPVMNFLSRRKGVAVPDSGRRNGSR